MKYFLPQNIRNKLRPAYVKSYSAFHDCKSILPLKWARPDFIIIGGQKCGTTSLYDYIVQHDKIIKSSYKEISYFNLNYNKSINWYLSHFSRKCNKEGVLTGESTPSYLFYEDVPGRLSANFPEIKIIILLRDPVSRAISHYYHESRLGYEDLGIYDALRQEENRLDKNLSKEEWDYNLYHYSYLARSKYSLQIARYLDYFDKTQILFLKSENLFLEPEKTMGKVFDFLGVEVSNDINFVPKNVGNYSDINKEVLVYLESRLKEEKKTIKHILGSEFSW